MKLLLTLALIIIASNPTNAQGLVEEGNQWKVSVVPFSSPDIYVYSLKIEGDTILDNIGYKMVYYLNDDQNAEWRKSREYLRQDSTHRVYLKRDLDEKILLYNFNLQLNDTFLIDESCTLIVTKVDTIYLNNGEPRRSLVLAPKSDPN